MSMPKIALMATKALLITGLTSNFAYANADKTKLIYGSDNREDVANHADAQLVNLAKSVAGQVRSSKLHDLDDEFFGFLKKTLRDMGICKEERFSAQRTLPRCTGFLVAKDILVTAGHCVTSMADCTGNKWVFDYTADKETIAKKDVYSCTEILGQKLTMGIFATKDYAILRLDRVVKDRAPLKLKMKGNPKKGADIAVIGHPSGLPFKIATGATIKKTRINFFYANLDTYAGNSGSPVFDENSGEVLGILIQGDRDYIKSATDICQVSNRVSNKNGKEKVFKIKKAKELKDLID
jgi:V8-like Glu-specific endopeptidase